MKGYTNLEQSKKLAEILSLESADMYYSKTKILNSDETDYIVKVGTPIVITDVPCWSLAALLDVLPKTINHNTLFIETSPALWHIGYRGTYIARSENLIDACYEMILELRELNLL